MDPDIIRYLRKLEREARDDFDLLLTGHAEEIPDLELSRITGKWHEKYRTFQQLHKLNIRLGVSSPIFLALAFLFGWLGLSYLANVTLMLFPATFILFVIGSFWLKGMYGSKGELEHTGRMIREAWLRRREQD